MRQLVVRPVRGWLRFGLAFVLAMAGALVLAPPASALAVASPEAVPTAGFDQLDAASFIYDLRTDFARPPPGDTGTSLGGDPEGLFVPAFEEGRVLRVSPSLGLDRVAPSPTGGGARFVVNSAGDALDTARITIPEGKFGYLLNNPSKSGVFTDSMGFTQGTLDPALRAHLVDNFGTATRSVPMVGGGTKFSVTGPLIGPSGQKWTITTAWGVDPNGTIRLITATP